MARLLVKLVDYTIAGDAKADRVQSFKAGDIVKVYPDGHVFGLLEGPPKFTVVDMPGTVEELEYLEGTQNDQLTYRVVDAALEDPLFVMELDQALEPQPYRCRRYKYNTVTGQIQDKNNTPWPLS